MERLFTFVAACLLCFASQAAVEVQHPSIYHHPRLGLTVFSGFIDLPSDGWWIVADDTPSALTEIFLTPSKETLKWQTGQRSAKQEDQRRVQQGRYPLNQIYQNIIRFAMSHEGMAPVSLDELPQQPGNKPGTELSKRYFYIGGGKLLEDLRNQRSITDADRMLAFEKTPAIDDGSHFLLFASGRIERRPVDAALVAKHQVKIVPEAQSAEQRFRHKPETFSYQLLARKVSEPGIRFTFPVVNTLSDQTLSVRWDIAQSTPGSEDAFKTWIKLRTYALPFSRQETELSTLSYWLLQSSELYATGGDSGRRLAMGRLDANQRGGRQTDMFALLGGRAAIRETLQLQSLAPGRSNGAQQAAIPVESIEGVKVKSHPFEEMLGSSAGGRLELANVVPHDRFFAYFATANAMLEMLEGGTEFIFKTAPMMTGRNLDYGLNDRYFKRLGINRTWLRHLLNGGAVQDLALVLPDLFVIDGTDISVVARLGNPSLAAAALKLLGVGDVSSGTVITNKKGQPVYWSRRDDLLIISSHKDEHQRVLNLHAAGGEQSLGKSAEFRYMLTKLPLQTRTTSYFYFSDPFIRRLVGPEVKISQLRRLQARRELESISAGALLYQYDGHQDAPTLDKLTASGYARTPGRATDARLDENLVTRSERYGRAANMKTLLDNRVTQASKGEDRQYKQYLENYNSFWRRFFDPIAIRVNKHDAKEYELSLFILPLVDNTIYNNLRDFLAHEDSSQPLQTPDIEPPPVAMISLNIDNDAWSGMSDSLGKMLTGLVGLSPAILNFIDTDLHLALADGDPIIGIGGGELAQTFGLLQPRGGADSLAVWGMMVAMLTRPGSVMVGLKEPERVLRMLQSGRVTLRGARGGSMFSFTPSVSRVADENKWIYTANLGNLITISFGVEVQDRYLVIKTLPLTQVLTIRKRKHSPNNGARITMNPGSADRLLPSLFASAMEKQSAGALAGISYLYPLLASGAGSIEEAQALHGELYGFKPYHPYPGEWQWKDKQLTSTVFGTAKARKQPPYQPGYVNFGLLQNIDNVDLSMQFEDDGLRATTVWTLY